MDAAKAHAVLVIAETGSITTAAEKLGYTASGVSRMVETAEAELGFPLFTRSHRGMALTIDGMRMLPTLRQLDYWESQVMQVASEIKGVVTGQLTVSSYFSIAAAWLPTVLRRFGERFPGVRVDVVEGGNSELATYLVGKRVDLGLVSRSVAERSGDEFINLYTDQMVVWLPRDHALAKLDAIPRDALNDQPFLMPLPGTNNDVESYFEANGIHVDRRFSSRDAGALYAMVEAGLGLSMNNALMSARLSGDVAERPLDPPYTIDLGCAMPSFDQASPAARRFLEVSVEVVNEMYGSSIELPAGWSS
jgi:DNA-binding transcriptional LysR family regulator